MKEFKFTIDGKEYSAAVNELEDNFAEVTLNGKTYKVELEKTPATTAVRRPTVSKAPVAAPAASATASAPKAADIPAGGYKVTSPLPGSIMKILVSEGQDVKKGDTLLTLESMKMENAIMADRDGKVTKVAVTVGQSVMQEDLLVVLG